MSATNSRIAHLRRIKADLQDEYWGRKANHTIREAANFGALMDRLNQQIELEKLRTVDYLKTA